MVKKLTAQHIFRKGNSFGVRSYWFTFLVDCDGLIFIIEKKTGHIIYKVDKTKVKWGA